MILLASAAFLVGVVLERFFRAWVIVPTCIVVLMVVVVRAAEVGDGLPHAILEFAVLITSAQIGYAFTLVLAAVPRIFQRLSSHPMHDHLRHIHQKW